MAAAQHVDETTQILPLLLIRETFGVDVGCREPSIDVLRYELWSSTSLVQPCYGNPARTRNMPRGEISSSTNDFYHRFVVQASAQC